jgi:hypothetical protein
MDLKLVAAVNISGQWIDVGKAWRGRTKLTSDAIFSGLCLSFTPNGSETDIIAPLTSILAIRVDLEES